MLKIFVISVFCLNLYAKDIEKKFRVLKIQKNKDIYNIHFNESAPIYHAKKSLVKCLGGSLERREFVKIKFDNKTFEVRECYALSDSAK